MNSTTVVEYEETPRKKVEGFVPESIALSTAESQAVQPLIWKNIIGIAILHFLAFYAFATSYKEAKFWTWIFSKFLIHY